MDAHPHRSPSAPRSTGIRFRTASGVVDSAGAALWLTVAVALLLLTLVPGTLSWLSHLVGLPRSPRTFFSSAALVLLL